MRLNHAKIAAAADVATATIAAAMAAATVDDGPNRAGNNQHHIQCFGLRDDAIHPGEPRCYSFITSRIRRLTVRESTANEIKRRSGRRTGNTETAHQLVQWQLGQWDLSYLRPSWLHRSALLLELAGCNHWSRA